MTARYHCKTCNKPAMYSVLLDKLWSSYCAPCFPYIYDAWTGGKPGEPHPLTQKETNQP